MRSQNRQLNESIQRMSLIIIVDTNLRLCIDFYSHILFHLNNIRISLRER